MDDVFEGVLDSDGASAFLRAPDGARLLADELIWPGYLSHWHGRGVRARRLPQRDYERGRPIVILWPDEPRPAPPFVELYYNERLIRYPSSRLGHLSVDVDGEVFNFAMLRNEIEVLTPEEYFYRPALGEFAPDPIGGTYREDPVRPYYDKFGRLFMRTVHVLHVEGMDTRALSARLHRAMEEILSTPADPRRPDRWGGFSTMTRSCATIVRDALRDTGHPELDGVFPRDVFVAAAWHLSAPRWKGALRVSLRRMPQLRVHEAPPSRMTPLLDPRNRVRLGLLALRGLRL